ncbi:MAG: hypothetical protein NTV22_19045 [bacterium]|nr:hypothetical protein [bacterium]
MSSGLMQEFEYYLAHQSELVAKYNGKVLAIKDQKVIGVYDSELQAIQETRKTCDMGSFLVQKCAPGNQEYTATYHSRVAFA